MPLNGVILSSRILVVDDAEVNRELIAEYLTIAGFTNFVEAANGEEALRLAAETKPDIVILDIGMPGIDGYEVCRRLRADGSDNVPILMQTALSGAGDRTKAFAAGATDFIAKPILRSEMIARIRLHLENRFAIKRLTEYRARVAAELEVASAMQRSLLPGKPDRDAIARELGIHVGAEFMTSSELGGDLWGMRRLDADRVAIFTADFSGHGVTAAMNCFRLHTMLSMLGDAAVHPGAVLEQINARLNALLPPGQFLALLYMVVDTRHDRVDWAGGACTPPMLISRATGEARPLDTIGLPLGARPSTRYETHEARFGPGDALFLYSDALVETRDENGMTMSEDAIMACFANYSSERGPEAWLHDVLDRFFHKRSARLEDDLTAVLVCRSPSARPERAAGAEWRRDPDPLPLSRHLHSL